MKKYEAVVDRFLRYSGLVAFFVLWEAAPRLGWADPQFLPPLSAVLQSIYWLAVDGELYSHLIVSLWRALVGLMLAALVALPLGFILGARCPETARHLDPLFRLLSQVNPFSLAPVFMLCFGIGEISKLMTIALVALWPILFHTITGVRMVDPLLVKTARSLTVTRGVMVSEVLLPGAFPTIISGFRVATQMTVFMLIAAEMLGAAAGLGWLVHNSAMLSQIPRMYAGGAFIILLGIIINQILLKVERESMFWRECPGPVTDEVVRSLSGKTRSLYVAAFACAFAFVLICGSQEVRRVNIQGLHSDKTASHQHNHGGLVGPLRSD
ncbi:MAG TPA: ABC transporter permease [Patescibacteria group bacterium]|nr:ABC transporter permease [Patescibacteria group bacterium]